MQAPEPPTPGTAAARAGALEGPQGLPGDIVIRPLDPRVRARWSRRTASGGWSSTRATRSMTCVGATCGTRLETALREVCATLPEATVPEFERKVNEGDAGVARVRGHTPQAAVGTGPDGQAGL
ncbi:MAG: hypothetical protein R3C32_06525 [Chloroflexota bacterium]